LKSCIEVGHQIVRTVKAIIMVQLTKSENN